MNAPISDMEAEAAEAVIVLPFPSAILSGHAEQGRWEKARAVKQHREWAIKATLAVRNQLRLSLTDNSDIPVSVTFYPPDRRGDRVNFPNRMKPYWDGVADALTVNDRRFLPTFIYAAPEYPGRVEVTVG